MDMNTQVYQTVVIEKSHRQLRHRVDEIAEQYAQQGLSHAARMSRRFEWLCRQEVPTLLPGERICMLRTIENIPDIFTASEWDELRRQYKGHEAWHYTNLTIDYARLLESGFNAVLQKADEHTARSVNALMDLVDRYRETAIREGYTEIAANLERAPRYGANSFMEALQLIRIANFGLWLEGNTHNTLGRFDQYLYPYFRKDMDAGKLDKDSALELIEEFFLSLNKDSDLYPGVQQGDNGQSLMLGGKTAEGNGFNELSELCLRASCELKVIDPKINVRVDKNTPDEVYTLCSELTKVGLGFPQYSNDDIVIPGLEALGYAHEDAINYVTAACWECIIPAVGGDIDNIAALSLPSVVDTCLRRDIQDCATYEEFYQKVDAEIRHRCDELCASFVNMYTIPSPLLQSLMRWENGPKYRNYGMHGVGLSTAADSLTAIATHVFEKKDVEAQRLIYALDTDFADEPELYHLLRYETPKLGQNEDAADANLVRLLDSFAEALKGKTNEYGGCWRGGTGSAMYYLWMADEIGATPDGRRSDEPFAANYSISLFTQTDGPFSVLRSMTAPDMTKVINGGPLTLEFHDTMFRTPDAVRQIGQFVKQFVLMGGHQLQLNAVNAVTLRDAQKNPEKYPQLIVRIWGWSAYFVELDRAFQNHVIARQEYQL